MKWQTILCAILLLAIGLRLPYGTDPLLSSDESHYWVGGEIIRNGGVPYIDFAFHRMPAIFYLYSVAFSLPGGILPLRTIWIVVGVLTLLTLFVFGNTVFSKGPALIAAALFAIFSTSYFDLSAANTETFMIFPLTLSVLALYHGGCTGKKYWFFLSGILQGIGILFKLPAVFQIVLFLYPFTFSLPWKKRSQMSLMYLFGTALPLLLFALYMWFHGALQLFIQTTILDNILYAGSVPVWLFILKFAKGTTKFIVLGNALVWVAALVGLRYLNSEKQRSLNALFALWFLGSVLGVVAGKRFFGHYFLQILPPLALIGGLGLYRVWQSLHRFELRHPVKIFFILLLCMSVALPLVRYQGLYLESRFTFSDGFVHPISRDQLVGEYIRQNTSSKDKIFIWSFDIDAYYWSKRLPSTTVPNIELATTFGFSSIDTEINPEMVSRLRSELITMRPSYILDYRNTPGDITSRYIDEFSEFDLLLQNYVLETTIGNVDIYVLRNTL